MKANTPIKEINRTISNRETCLDLSDYGMKDIPEEIVNCKLATVVFLSGNEIEDISILEEMTWVRVLFLTRNKVVDISPLRHLSSLEELGLDSNRIVDISSLSELSKLNYLSMRRNLIVDDSSLVTMCEKRGIGIINLQDNLIETAGLLRFREKGLRVFY